MKRFHEERGAALVIALLVLLVLSFLEIALIVTTTTETKVSSIHLRDRQALEVAEAGIEEVIGRMRLSPGEENYVGDASFPLNPDWVTVIHLNDTENDTSADGDTIYTKSTQLNNPAEELLRYSTTELSALDDLLIVRHKTRGDSIYFCDLTDRSQYLEARDHGGFPVEIVEANGRRGEAERRIVAEVCRILLPASIPADAALYTGEVIDFEESAGGWLIVCGHNHRRALPLGTGDYDPPDCDSAGHWYHKDPCVFPWEGRGTDNYTWANRDPENCDPAGCVVGVKFPADKLSPTLRSGEEYYGNPAWQKVVNLNETTFPPLYEVLGFENEDSMNVHIGWIPISSGDPAEGMCRATGGHYQINESGSGWGLLWVKGSGTDKDLILDPNVVYDFKGLIYVEGGIQSGSNSELRVLGACMLKKGGRHHPRCNEGRLVFCYSSEAIGWYLMEDIGLYEVLSWREK